MQPQKAEVQSLFHLLAGLQHFVATWQRHTQAARVALRARRQKPGIVLRAIGAIDPPKGRAPLRLVAPDAKHTGAC